MNEFYNLTNGLECLSFRLPASEGPRYCYIQSSHCEARKWDRVLHGAGPDMFMHLALGYEVKVHDRSEMERIPRAMWQGLRWIEIACQQAWDLPGSAPAERGGKAMDDYFRDVWHGLDRSTKRYVDHYGRWSIGMPLSLRSCTCWDPVRNASGAGPIS